MGWSAGAWGRSWPGYRCRSPDYATQTLAEVLPFRDTLACLFFISVGMLLDLRFVMANLPLVAASVATVVLLKWVAAAAPTLLAGYPLHVAVLTGLAAGAPVGEFSFILAERGLHLKLLDRDRYRADFWRRRC
ncbi:MAG: cation:proton antiporter [Gemmataceae bacterium]